MCPYCSQIRAYLDYYGFTYRLTEVDSYDKAELAKFTKARTLPIVVLEDRVTRKRWHLVNATSVLSALESLRNEPLHINYETVLNRHLPVFRSASGTATSSHHQAAGVNKYHVATQSKEDEKTTATAAAETVEWRKWINNAAIPVLRLNSIDTFAHLLETVNGMDEGSLWRQRYAANPLKYWYVYAKNLYKTSKLYGPLLERCPLASNESSAREKPREALHRVVSEWEKGLDQHGQFMSGAAVPNLADFSLFGSFRAFRHCDLFRDAIATHPKFREWFDNMERQVVAGVNHHKVATHLISSEMDDANEQLVVAVDDRPVQAVQTGATSAQNHQEQEQQPNQSAVVKMQESVAQESVQVRKEESAKAVDYGNSVRILTLNYLTFVAAFAYASLSKR